jgi:hypothetical protein
MCYRVAGSGGLCEGAQLQETVRGFNFAHSARTFQASRKQELAEAECLFDLGEPDPDLRGMPAGRRFRAAPLFALTLRNQWGGALGSNAGS